MEDKKIKCIDCHKDFIFSAGEQEFFEEKGYSEPVRCKDCRSKRKPDKEPAVLDGTDQISHAHLRYNTKASQNKHIQGQ